MARVSVVCFIFLSLSLGGCSLLWPVEGVTFGQVNRSIDDIQTAIKVLYGIQYVSVNHRVFVTLPCRKDLKDTTPTLQLKERVYARFIIIGESRPYEIHVQVYDQNKVGSEWEDGDINEQLSQTFSMELRDELLKGRDNRNVIDDFRAF